jgi:hypothetical protein
MSPADALARLYESADVDPDWFAPSFLEAVPIATVREVHAKVISRGGAFRCVREVRDGLYEVVFERAAFNEDEGAFHRAIFA